MHITKDDIAKLANLSRVAVSEEEQEALLDDLEHILAYVSEVNTLTADAHAPGEGELTNVNLRADVDPHESGIFTEAILAEVPTQENGYIKVRKIISED